MYILHYITGTTQTVVTTDQGLKTMSCSLLELYTHVQSTSNNNIMLYSDLYTKFGCCDVKEGPGYMYKRSQNHCVLL